MKMGVYVRIEDEMFNRIKGSENNLKFFFNNMEYDVDSKVMLLFDFFLFFSVCNF